MNCNTNANFSVPNKPSLCICSKCHKFQESKLNGLPLKILKVTFNSNIHLFKNMPYITPIQNYQNSEFPENYRLHPKIAQLYFLAKTQNQVVLAVVPQRVQAQLQQKVQPPPLQRYAQCCSTLLNIAQFCSALLSIIHCCSVLIYKYYFFSDNNHHYSSSKICTFKTSRIVF